MNAIFREAKDSDIGTIQSMVDNLYDGDPATKGICADVSLTYRHFFSYPEKGRLIVIQNGDQIIGYCIVVFFWSNEYQGNIIEIDEMYIGENYRGRGICAKLFEWLEQEFEADLAGFALQCSENNLAAMSATKKLGFMPSRNKHMIRLHSANEE